MTVSPTASLCPTFPTASAAKTAPSIAARRYRPDDTEKVHPRVVEVWKGPSAYSAMDTEGEFVLFEGGAAYRYASVMIVRTNLTVQ